MNIPTISKSSFIRGTKCPKSLYLHFFQPEEQDEISESQQQIFDMGHNVGFLAQQLFPGGIDASRGAHEKVNEALSYTQELINNGQKVIYEAAFSDGETLCYMDILVKENSEWRSYEVKASTGVKDYHVMDVAFQYYVITRSGLPLTDIYMVHINNQYIRHGVIDVEQLFTKVFMTGTILPKQVDIPGQLKSLQEMLTSGLVPHVEMGYQCTHPYNCDFIEFCRQGLPVEPGASESHPANRNQEALDEFKEELGFPLFFMDFETIFPAIPIHDESRPYQQIPFQFSLHVQRSEHGPLEHYEFLGTPPVDPRYAFIEELLARLGDSGSIIVWNQGFEMNRLREIARDFPDYALCIEPVLDRFADLMVPFRRKHLYLPEMNGSYSLKAVLPALVPELSYSELGIQEGGAASMAYEQLYHEEELETTSKIRRDLLEYCKMDTLAMVKILEEFN